MAPHRPPRRPVAGMTAREWLLATLGAAAPVAVGVALSLAHRAFDVPRNDDWVYLRAVERFVASGKLEPDPFSNAIGVGQTALGAPLVAWLGPHFWVVHLLGPVFCTIILLFYYATVRHLLRPRWAAFVVAVLAFSPQFLPLAATFMSDLPAVAFQAVALWAGGMAVRRGGEVRLGWFAGALLASFGGFTIRETALVAGLAVAAGTAWYCWRFRRRWVAPLLVTLAWLGLAVVLYAWRLKQASPVQKNFGVDVGVDRLQHVSTTFTTLALMTVPVVAVLLRRVVVACRRMPVIAPLAVFLGMTFTQWMSPLGFLLGNYLRSTGVAAETVHGPAPLVIPEPFWSTLGFIACTSFMLGLLVLLESGIRLARRRRLAAPEADEGPRAVMWFYVVGMVTLVMLVRIVGSPLFDRYLFPVVPVLGALWLRANHRELSWRVGRVLGVVALVCWSVIGLVVADASATFDGSKWRAAQQIADTGIPKNRINGGYEWFGYWQNRTIEPREIPERLNPDFYVSLYPDPGICAEVAFPKWRPWYLETGVEEGTNVKDVYPDGVWRLIGTHTERTLLGMRYTYELRTTTPTCAPR